MDDYAHRLLRSQQSDGSWPAATFYADPVKNNKTYYNGAPALSTAMVIEALSLYLGKSSDTGALGGINGVVRISKPLRRDIMKLARSQCRSLELGLRSKLLESLERLSLSSNGPEIMSLASHFNLSLNDPLPMPGWHTPSTMIFSTRRVNPKCCPSLM
jgi:hypothetical protein